MLAFSNQPTVRVWGQLNARPYSKQPRSHVLGCGVLAKHHLWLPKGAHTSGAWVSTHHSDPGIKLSSLVRCCLVGRVPCLLHMGWHQTTALPCCLAAALLLLQLLQQLFKHGQYPSQQPTVTDC